jgi:hypothetical protein
MPRRFIVAGAIALSIAVPVPAHAQLASRDGSDPAQKQTVPPHRTRLILKDGTYQIVMSYKVVGSRVQFVSAERGGEVEEIPLDLVDLDATKRWDQQHSDASLDANGVPQRPAPPLNPELLKEEAERTLLAPEVAPDLHLVPEDTALALDTWQGTPELVPLMQSEGDLNKETGHSILRGIINPNSTTHQLLVLKGEKAAVQMHVADPAFYIRMDDDEVPSGDVLTVDTHGASSSSAVKQKPLANARYAIVRVDVRQDARVVASFNTSREGSTRREEDVIQTSSTLLPGGHWTKIVPTERLLFGEYCLIEILADNQVNLSVWDFGVHPTAPENRDVILPEKRRTGLAHRPSEE